MMRTPAPTYSSVLWGLGTEGTLFSHFVQHACASGSRYSDWATDWMVRGSNPGRGKIYSFFFFQKHPDRVRGPPSFLSIRYRGSFPGVRWSECEVNLSPPSSSEVNNKWRYACTPPVCPHGVDREKYTFMRII